MAAFRAAVLLLSVALGACDLCSPIAGHDCVGNDLFNVTGVSSPAACCALCTGACTVWKWDPSHTCYAKNGCDNVYPCPSCVTGSDISPTPTQTASPSQTPPPPSLSITFPHGEAGLPSIFVGGKLWADAAEILIGAGGARCAAGAPGGATTTGSGSDAWGSFNWTETPYAACGAAFVARVSVYAAVPAARFTVTFPGGVMGTNLSNNTMSPSLAPIAAFPSFPADAPWPGQHNFAWGGGQLGFSPYPQVGQATFSGQTGNVPSPLFFTDLSRGNATLTVAPLDHVHGWACNALAPPPGAPRDATTAEAAGVAWGCGVMNTVAALPVGFSATTLLWAGAGVTATLGAWGAALRTAFNTTRLPDLQTTKLGIYTDNGAFYNNVQNCATRRVY